MRGLFPSLKLVIVRRGLGLSLPNEKDKKALSFVGKINANIILTFSRPTSNF